MANKQSVGAVHLGGGQMSQTMRPVVKPVIDNTIIDTKKDELNDFTTVLSSGQQYLIKLQKTEEENIRLKTIAALGNYRKQLYAAQNPEEFDQLVSNAPGMLEAMFSDAKEADFWRQNGAEILRRNQLDSEKIRAEKSIEFGKKSLEELLANGQKTVALMPEINGAELIENGIDEIERSDFLSDEEKADYRSRYLNDGILNLALQNSKQAEYLRQKYLAEDEHFKKQFDEVKKLKDSVLEKSNEKQKNEEYLHRLDQVFHCWAQKERGDIDEAQYYILLNNEDNKLLWGDNENRSQTPLSEAYKMIKKIGANKDGSAVSDVRDISGYLMNAYHQKKISLDEASDVFSQLINPSYLVFNDQYSDVLLDEILALDTMDNSDEGKLFMEKKAELFFDVYNEYNTKKKVLAEEYKAQGGKLNDVVLKRIGRQAVNEIKEEFGFKTENEALSFGDIKRTLKSVYSGRNTTSILEKFCKQAPFVEDKKELLKNLALEEEKKELALPRFYSLKEVLEADLSPGERFYYNGRIAVKS